MSGDRHDVDSEIVLPAGMELVVPPAASSAIPPAGADREPEREVPGATLRPRSGSAAREGQRRPPAA